MHLAKHKRKTSMPMNMTPMIDVVFLLLIFFMIVNRITEANKDPDVEVPDSLENVSRESEPREMIVNVNRDGEIIVRQEKVRRADFPLLVRREIDLLDNQPNRLTILLRADRNGKCATVNYIVTSLVENGVQNVNIGVREEG